MGSLLLLFLTQGKTGTKQREGREGEMFLNSG